MTVYDKRAVDAMEKAYWEGYRELRDRVTALEERLAAPPLWAPSSMDQSSSVQVTGKYATVRWDEWEATKAVVEAAVAYADRHMTGMGALASTGVVTDETQALWGAVQAYRGVR